MRLVTVRMSLGGPQGPLYDIPPGTFHGHLRARGGFFQKTCFYRPTPSLITNQVATLFWPLEAEVTCAAHIQAKGWGTVLSLFLRQTQI